MLYLNNYTEFTKTAKNRNSRKTNFFQFNIFMKSFELRISEFYITNRKIIFFERLFENMNKIVSILYFKG